VRRFFFSLIGVAVNRLIVAGIVVTLAALLRLPEKRREVLFLRYYLGYSDTEISQIYGINRSTVFRRRKIALRLMQKEMEALESEK